MLCERPYRKGIQAFGCGGCRACRVNRSRVWSCRLLLESMEHSGNSFVTLTYDEQSDPGGNLNPRDLELFLKRIREKVRAWQPKLRYFAVGEYGDQTMRPHYHLILFGLDPLLMEGKVKESWSNGFSMTGIAEISSMLYCAGYVQKKLWRKVRKHDRHPEFRRMSCKPGLGIGVAQRIAASYASVAGRAALEQAGTISSQIRVGGKKFALGRYLREKALDECGISKDERKVATLKALVETWNREAVLSARDIENRRKARVSQQCYRERKTVI